MNGGIVLTAIARNRLLNIQDRMIGLQGELESNYRGDLPGTSEELDKVLEASKIILDHVQKRLV